MRDLSGKTALVTGASRGIGRASPFAFAPPGAPQLRGRAIDQPGDFAINLGQVLVAKPVLSGVVWTETGERLAKVLASRSIVD